MFPSMSRAKVQPTDEFDDLAGPSGHQERCSGHMELQALEGIEAEQLEDVRLSCETPDNQFRVWQKIRDMGLSCGKHEVHQQAPQPLMHGEVEFSGSDHRALYIIAPREMENADEILRWMFVREDGWKLTPPSFLLSCYGGRDHYENWAKSVSPEAWEWPGIMNASETELEIKLREKFTGEGEEIEKDTEKEKEKKEKAKKTEKEKEMDKFNKKFTARMSEIAAGVCQAMNECGCCWFDLGCGERGGFNEVLKDGLKVHWSAFRSLAGHKTNAVVFCIRLLGDTQYQETFVKCAEDVPTTSGQNPGPLTQGGAEFSLPVEVQGLLQRTVQKTSQQTTKEMYADTQRPPKHRLLYPKVATKELIAGDENFEVRAGIAQRFLCNALTHIVFVQNRQVLDTLRSKLRTLAPRAAIFANGEESLIQPGLDGKILREAMFGVPVVCLHNTGGAAEMLGAAVLRRRQNLQTPPKHFRDPDPPYALPKHVPEDKFLILDAAKDSVEKVVRRVTLVLSVVHSVEMTQVGFAKSEEARLRYAWEQYLLYFYNANIFRKWARVLQYTAMTLSVLLTILAVLYSERRSFSGLSLLEEHLRVSLLVLPCLSAFVLTSISRLNYVNKWAALTVCSVRVKSEIYQYRCRALDYQPRKGTTTDFKVRVEELCGPPTDDPAKTDDAAKEKQEKANEKQQKAKAALPKGTSPQGTFSATLEQINSDAVGSDVRGDYLRKPPVSAMNAFRKSLYDFKSVQKAHQRRNGFFRMRYKEPDWQWRKSGVDFYQNPYATDDDYLRDDGISPVTAEDYIHFRFLPMLQYYVWRSRDLSRKMTALQVSIFFLTAVLAAASPLGYEVWIPIVVSIISFLASILEFEGFSSQLRNVNQSLESLKNRHFWWHSLSMVERRMPSNMNELVASTEATADSEISAWQKTLKVKGLKAGNSTGEEDAVENDDQAQSDHKPTPRIQRSKSNNETMS